jgi:hypothetical protein
MSSIVMCQLHETKVVIDSWRKLPLAMHLTASPLKRRVATSCSTRTSISLPATSRKLRINGVAYTGKFSFTKIATRAGFTFVYDLAGLNPKGMQSAGTISFVISGVTIKQLEQGYKKNPYSWGGSLLRW